MLVNNLILITNFVSVHSNMLCVTMETAMLLDVT